MPLLDMPTNVAAPRTEVCGALTDALYADLLDTLRPYFKLLLSAPERQQQQYQHEYRMCCSR